MINKKNIKDISLEVTPESVNFCSLWPAAKTGLEALAAIVKNPFIKAVIKKIIELGDAIC